MIVQGWYMWLRVHASTQRQQERAHTLQVTALEFSLVRKLRSACRERYCNMCLTGSLTCASISKDASDPRPRSQQAFALGFIRSVCSLLARVVSLGSRLFVYFERFNFMVEKICREFFILEPKPVLCHQKSHTLRFSIV